MLIVRVQRNNHSREAGVPRERSQDEPFAGEEACQSTHFFDRALARLHFLSESVGEMMEIPPSRGWAQACPKIPFSLDNSGQYQ